MLAVVVIGSGGVSPSAVGTNTPLAHMVVSPIATCTGGVLLPPTGADTVFILEQLALCGGGFWWWWYMYFNVMVVVVSI